MNKLIFSFNVGSSRKASRKIKIIIELKIKESFFDFFIIFNCIGKFIKDWFCFFVKMNDDMAVIRVGVVPYNGQYSLANNNRVACCGDGNYMLPNGGKVSEQIMYGWFVENHLNTSGIFPCYNNNMDLVDKIIESDSFEVKRPNIHKLVITFKK